MLEIGQDDTFVLADNIFLQKIEELNKYWAFNTDTGEHFSLNATSYWIIEQIAENKPVENILEEFLKTFEVDHDCGKKDYYEILNHFIEEELIKRRVEE